jgi:hypothetical protein
VDTQIQRYKESKDKGKIIKKLGNEFYGMKGKQIYHMTQHPKQKTDIELNQNQLSEMRYERYGLLWNMRKLKNLKQSEVNMKEQVIELERKENTYVEYAHGPWPDMENSKNLLLMSSGKALHCPKLFKYGLREDNFNTSEISES